MAKRTTRFPLESFDPRFRELLLKGAVEEIVLEFDTARKAIAFQQRLHTYRSQVRKSGDETYTLLYRARTSRRDHGTKDDPSTLKIFPADSQWGKVFEQVDLTHIPMPAERPKSLLDIPETKPEDLSPQDRPTIDDLLADLKGEK